MAQQRAYRRKNGNIQTQKYERKNPKGFMMRVYRNMLSRVTGVQRKKFHLYEGLELLPKEEFYSWALAPDSDFWSLWTTWQMTGQRQADCPSIDREDPTKGYILDNMRWLPHSENSRLTRANRSTHGR